MAGLRALFQGKQLQNIFDQFQNDVDYKVLQSFQYIGEEFVNKARLIKTYKDDTGNLRSSIGYIILKDGKEIYKAFKLSEKGSDKHTGKGKGEEFASEIGLQHPKGYVLIGVSGMNYSAAVEARGYDVITGSAPGSNALGEILRGLL